MAMREAGDGGFHGLEISYRVFGGARAIRVVHPEHQQICSHRHDWPYLSLPALGSYADHSDGGQALIPAPAVVFHPAGHEHANSIGRAGLETLSIEFDPAWLRREGSFAFDRAQIWIGGAVAREARRLAAAWKDPALTEAVLAARTARLLRVAAGQGAPTRPAWLQELLHALDKADRPRTAVLARRLGLNTAWLARAYRAATGEGLHETLRRRGVERASILLRRSGLPLAEVALESGFCDQSHMNRAFRALSGRTPLQVRLEGARLSSFAGSA